MRRVKLRTDSSRGRVSTFPSFFSQILRRRSISAAGLSLLITACVPSGSEQTQSLVPFANDTGAPLVSVTTRNGDYQVPVFNWSPNGNVIDELNIYLIPPPSRYVFDARRQKFRYWNHYQNFSTASAVERMASHFSTSVPLVVIAIPGTYGSAAPPALQHQLGVVEIVDKALDRLKLVSGVRRFNLAAQSTTAPIAAALMTRRSDLGCLALSSGPFDYPALVAQRNWPSMYSGAYDPFSMMELVDDVRPDPSRQVILVADRNDHVVPVASSEAFSEALARNGHNVRLVRMNTSDPAHHALQYEAIRELIACEQNADAGSKWSG